jgi:hypothetical protein
VRGFTQHPSSGVSRPGTFAGLAEKIPYLQALGVNAVELMPVWAFEESDSDRVDPFTGERLLNYWGYSPIAFFAPHAPYASRTGGRGAVPGGLGLQHARDARVGAERRADPPARTGSVQGKPDHMVLRA